MPCGTACQSQANSTAKQALAGPEPLIWLRPCFWLRLQQQQTASFPPVAACKAPRFMQHMHAERLRVEMFMQQQCTALQP